jgi:hypothetical protein
MTSPLAGGAGVGVGRGHGCHAVGQRPLGCRAAFRAPILHLPCTPAQPIAFNAPRSGVRAVVTTSTPARMCSGSGHELDSQPRACGAGAGSGGACPARARLSRSQAVPPGPSVARATSAVRSRLKASRPRSGFRGEARRGLGLGRVSRPRQAGWASIASLRADRRVAGACRTNYGVSGTGW